MENNKFAEAAVRKIGAIKISQYLHGNDDVRASI